MEEITFKVSDWVRNNKDSSWITQLKESDMNAYNGKEGYVNLGKEFKLWKPTEGEWCVDEACMELFQYTYKSLNKRMMQDIKPLEFAITLKNN